MTTSATSVCFPPRPFISRTTRCPTRPAATWRTSSSATPTKSTKWSRWCAKRTRGACDFTTATPSSRPACRCTRSAGTRVGWIVLASDASHLYANMRENRPFPIVYDVGQMIEGYRRLRELADAPELIVPGHDPLVMERYAAAKAELEGIAVRLDQSPKTQTDP